MIDTDNLISNLESRFQSSLLGYEAQKIMEPPMRGTFSLDQSSAKQAATLLGLYLETEWSFILIRRSGHPLDKHKGQISFPGGSIEANETPEYAAKREAEEEVNIPMNSITLLGKLSPLFIPISNFIVHPFVGLLDMETVELNKQDDEVDEILHIKLKDLLSEDSVSYKTMTMANGINLKDIPVFNIDGHTIWGATAMMLSEFKEIVKEL